MMPQSSYPVPPWMFGAVQNVESGGNPNAVSPAGAGGLMQIMPDTARQPGYGVQPLQGWDGVDPRTASQAEQQRFGNDYLQAMFNHFQGNQANALMAYNGGPGRVDKIVNGQISPQQISAETQAYVPKVMAVGKQYAQNGNIQSDTREVTDPELLRQLNSSSSGREVTDPALLAQLEGSGQPQQSSSPDYGSDIVNSMGAGIGKTAANISAEFATHPTGALANIVARRIVEGATRLAGEGYQALGGGLSEPAAHFLTYPMGGDPNSPDEQTKQMLATQAIPFAVKDVTGMDMNYQPQTKPGEYAASVGSALPYVAMGAPPLSAVGMGIGSQTGKDIASQFTNNPQYQEAASVVGGGAGAMMAPKVSANMQDLLKDESTSKTGILGLPTDTISINKPLDVSVEQMKNFGTQAYKSADAKGGIMGQQSFDNAVDDAISKSGDQLIKGKLPPGTNYVIEAQDYLKDLKGSSTSLADLDKVDDFLRDKIGQAFRGGLNKQGAALLSMRDTLRSASKSTTAADIVNPDAFADWQKGDKIWTAFRTAKDIQDGIKNAQLADVPSTAIKNYFKNFIKNQDNLAPLNADEIAAAKQAAHYGVITGALRTIGSRLGGHIMGTMTGGMSGLASGGGIGAAVGAPLGYIAGEMATSPFRNLAGARQAARGENVIKTIGQRPVIQSAAREAAGLPPIVPPVTPSPIFPFMPAIAATLGRNQ